MSDSHKGELNAIKASFPGIVRLRCYFHLIQNIQKKVRDFDLKPKMEYIIWVTKTLREAKTGEEFKNIWTLLKPELIEKTSNQEFVNAFEQDYVNSDSIWFNGGSFISKQKCNNSLESMNRYLKDHWTDRRSRSVLEFFRVMELSFKHYCDKCREEHCMPTEVTCLREYYNKAQDILTKHLIFKIENDTFCFMRISSKYKASKEEKEKELEKKMKKVKERLDFTQKNIRSKFSSLVNFTKIHCFFQIFSLNMNQCSFNSFWNRGNCKHRLATLMHLERIQNPYIQRVQEGSLVGRPRNLMN